MVRSRFPGQLGRRTFLHREEANVGYLTVRGRRRRRRAMVKVRGYAIPGVVMFVIWIVLIVLAIILLALIAHWAGGGLLDLRLGHFRLDIGFT
jgi:hypothetical protein